MNAKYIVSIKVEVLMEAYSDVLARLLRFLDAKHISLDDGNNIWVRMFFILRNQKDTLLEIETMEEAGKAEGMYLLAMNLLDSEYNTGSLKK